MSPGRKSTKRYGPVPMGLLLFGASRDFEPLYGAKTCFGMIIPVTIQYGVGCVNVTFTVCESSASICFTLRNSPTWGDAVAGSAAYSQLKTTSSAVNGLPSCHVTLRLRRHVTLVPSFDTPPFCRLGTSRASAGTMLPSVSNE